MAEKEPEKKVNRLRNELKENPEVRQENGKSSRRSKAKEETAIEEEQQLKSSAEGENKPRNEKKKEKAAPAPKKKSASSISSFINRIRTDEKLHRITGAFLLFIFAPYLTVAFVSYFFSWEADQDKVMGPLGTLLSGEVEVTNVLGKFGALLSHVFIHNWFGVTSFFFPLLAFLAGMRLLLGIRVLPFGKTLRHGLFFLVFGSLSLGFIFRDAAFYPGGVFGFETSAKLNAVVGAIGTGLLLVFTFLVYLIVSFNIKFDFLKKPATVPSESDTAIEEEFEKEEPKNILREEPVAEPGMEIVPPSEEPIATDEELPEPEPVMEPVMEKTEEAQEPEIELPVEPVAETLTDLSGDGDVQFTIEKKEESGELSVDEIDSKAVDLVREFGEYDPLLDLSGYQFPSIELLESYGGGKEPNVNTEELTQNKNRIVETLGNYGIAIDKIKATIGPTVTLYEIIPAAGVRISKIKNLEDDIALSLSALGIRIIAPIPGKGTIGIEVPNLNPEMVPMRTLMASEKFQNTNFDLPVALGKTISNEIFIADLSKMPHLLMAGATGQGKSVGLNAILVSLLYKKHPAQIKFVLVDPKKVELTLFNRIERHFLAKLPDSAEAIITDTKKVINTLNSLCIEMDTRYDLLKEAQCRNIKEYNAKFVQRKLNPNNGHRYLPYIVLVVDEFADLIMTAGKEVETPIARLAQLARAIGIHLIIATQRPSVNIITGTIKANFPSRIAFRVTSKIDSRTILDSGGAEQLIGKGDMLYSTGNDLIRLQCAFVDTPEVEKITAFIGDQRGYPDAFLLPEYVDENSEAKLEIDDGDRDSLFEEAARIVVQHQQGSASLLQRKLKLGYNRAGRIVDQLEAAGIIGPFEGSKAREVLIKDVLSLEEKLGKGKEDLL
jgi:S-DNA-T family DNA segregation ATPase FtsK/SpoIIIE